MVWGQSNLEECLEIGLGTIQSIQIPNTAANNDDHYDDDDNNDNNGSKNNDDNANYAMLFYNYISKEYLKKMGEINIFHNFILNFEK